MFTNPFRPGAGHMPPYLAGRESEKKEFAKLLSQDVILTNLVLTGLRGVGKTVLLETFRPLAVEKKWFWAGADMSESVSVSEENLAIRIITDLSVITSQVTLTRQTSELVGVRIREGTETTVLDYGTLLGLFNQCPGLISDKLKHVLEQAWGALRNTGWKGVVFAYDEAQNLADSQSKNQFPLSLLLDTFQSIQKKGIPFMLALTGLPTLFPRLVEARTYSERMFKVMHLERLRAKPSEEAILKPIDDAKCPVKLDKASVNIIVEESGGYPYFIQFICREVYDLLLQKIGAGDQNLVVPVQQITRKLDKDFFSGRWAKATDRQKQLLYVIAHLESAEGEFTVQEIVEKSRDETLCPKSFGASQVGQMLAKSVDAGLVYKDRHGKYLFAVPLMARFIQRQPNR